MLEFPWENEAKKTYDCFSIIVYSQRDLNFMELQKMFELGSLVVQSTSVIGILLLNCVLILLGRPHCL